MRKTIAFLSIILAISLIVPHPTLAAPTSRHPFKKEWIMDIFNGDLPQLEPRHAWSEQADALELGNKEKITGWFQFNYQTFGVHNTGDEAHTVAVLNESKKQLLVAHLGSGGHKTHLVYWDAEDKLYLYHLGNMEKSAGGRSFTGEYGTLYS